MKELDKMEFISLIDDFAMLCFSAGADFQKDIDLNKQSENMKKIKEYQVEIILRYDKMAARRLGERSANKPVADGN